MSFNCYSSAATFDTFNDQETEWNSQGIERLRAMEERGIRANSQTFVWLSKGCLSYGSLVEAKKIHGKILKVGF